MFNLWKNLRHLFGKRSNESSTSIINRLADDDPESCDPVAYDIVTSFLSDIGCQRELNEDQGRYITPGDPEVLAEKGMLFIVADGMGGHSGGEIASRLAVEVISRAYYEETAGTQDALKNAILEANDAIYSEAYKNRSLLGMGTTCTALVIQNAEAIAAQIGDSRLYLVREDEIYLMTEDHSLAMQLVNRGLLSLNQVRHHPERNVILRALGSHPMVEVATWKNPFPVRLGDKFILCSDGLYDLVEDEEIRQAVTEPHPHRACEALIDLAKGRGGYDNITVGIVYVVTKSAGGEKAVRPTREAEVLQ
jgi:protein phosphatase